MRAKVVQPIGEAHLFSDGTGPIIVKHYIVINIIKKNRIQYDRNNISILVDN